MKSSNGELFFDDVTVSYDSQIGPVSSNRGFCVGVGKDFLEGTFFSVMIDDVHVYNRAI